MLKYNNSSDTKNLPDHQSRMNSSKTRIVCIRPKGQTQCIFPRSQHTCLYIFWLNMNLYQVVFNQQSVWTLFKSLAQLFCKCSFFFKWPPVAILDVQKSLLTISDQYHNFYFFLQNGCQWPFWMSKTHFWWHFWPFQINTKLFFQNIFTKWPPAPILDVRNSLLNAFLAISDLYATLPFWMSIIHFRLHFWPF